MSGCTGWRGIQHLPLLIRVGSMCAALCPCRVLLLDRRDACDLVLQSVSGGTLVRGRQHSRPGRPGLQHAAPSSPLPASVATPPSPAAPQRDAARGQGGHQPGVHPGREHQQGAGDQPAPAHRRPQRWAAGCARRGCRPACEGREATAWACAALLPQCRSTRLIRQHLVGSPHALGRSADAIGIHPRTLLGSAPMFHTLLSSPCPRRLPPVRPHPRDAASRACTHGVERARCQLQAAEQPGGCGPL